ncbi:hypothetical protein [Anatilimnocola floriformis]|uniref:hypothetical protein n=1 Tax=Anatilimnocola floriformis TaxID=2948575 RepID=UPI0020C4C055|nr:hypothetical protein [Anatilimnocola floriformis]
MRPASLFANLPLRIIGVSCFLGMLPVVALVLFVAFHPLNNNPRSISQPVTLLAFVAFPYGLLLVSGLIVFEQRVILWLLVALTLLVLAVNTFACLGDALVADSVFRAQAAGSRYMNCGGTPLLFAIALSWLLAFAVFVCSVVSFGVNHWLLRSADRNFPPLKIPAPKKLSP